VRNGRIFMDFYVRIWLSGRWMWIIPSDGKFRMLEVRANQGYRYNRLRILLWYWSDRLFELGSIMR
jgi:hypothetical protein